MNILERIYDTGLKYLSRIRARLRQAQGADLKIKVADLVLNQKIFELKRGRKLIQLTPKEFMLIHHLMSNKNKILTREMILKRVWHYSPDVKTRIVDVYMAYLKKKIDEEFDKKLIHSVRGFGYMIKE